MTRIRESIRAKIRAKYQLRESALIRAKLSPKISKKQKRSNSHMNMTNEKKNDNLLFQTFYVRGYPHFHFHICHSQDVATLVHTVIVWPTSITVGSTRRNMLNRVTQITYICL